MTMGRNELKRIGGRCFDVALGVFLIAILALIWNSSRTNASSMNGSEGGKTMNARASLAGANGIMSIQGSVCIKDDSNGNEITFDTGGNYTFTDCAGFTLNGVGVYSQKGAVITLRHFGPDRRLDLTFDSAVRRAKLGLQFFPTSRIFTITDRNTADDVCGCAGNTQQRSLSRE